jgi:hypothetical protein
MSGNYTLRRPKHSKNEAVVPKEEEEEDWCHNMILSSRTQTSRSCTSTIISYYNTSFINFI